MSVLLRKRVLITGATGGLGRALADAFGAEGCKLLLHGRDAERADALAEALEDRHDVEAEGCAGDLGTDEGLDAVIEAMGAVGGVDVLINNAGIFPVGPATEVDRATFDDTFAVNVRAPFFLAQALIRASARHGHGWGRVVNVGSSSAFAGFPNTAVYCASKHALLGQSRSLFAEHRGSGIRVFSVHPGSIQTEMGRRVEGQEWDTFLDPAEVADFVVRMLRTESAMVTEEVRLNRFEVQ